MSRELDVQEGRSPAVRGGGGPFSRPLDRRSFLQCALASGAALGVCEFTQLFVLGATPARAGSQKQDDSRFTVEAKFYEKLPHNKKIKCKRSEERRVGKECRSRWEPY